MVGGVIHYTLAILLFDVINGHVWIQGTLPLLHFPHVCIVSIVCIWILPLVTHPWSVLNVLALAIMLRLTANCMSVVAGKVTPLCLEIVHSQFLQEVCAELHYLWSIAYDLGELVPCHHLIQIGLLEVVVVPGSVGAEADRDVGHLAHVVTHGYHIYRRSTWPPLLLPLAAPISIIAIWPLV